MNIRRYSRFVDYFFITIGIIILTFCWIRFYTRNATLSLILAIVLGISLGYLAYFVHSRRLHQHNISSRLHRNIQSLEFQLSFASHDTLTEYFHYLLSSQYPSITTSTTHLVADHHIIFYPHFSSIVDAQIIRQIVSALPNYTHINIIGSQFSKDATALCQSIRNIRINLLTTRQFLDKFHLLDKFTIPNIIDVTQPKLSLRQILSGILDRKKSKTYLILGLLLLFYSFFIPYKIYYLIFGTLLLLLAIFSRFTPQ
ncbi:MAG: hypothetical protein IKC79_00260 [Clostridia bacterium]|nr:hypothetical protein [Clostridia bacterium]